MDTTNWKWFRYDEIFDIKHGFYNKKPDDNPQGDIPFIGATDSNNGITSHSDLETIENTTKTGDGTNAPLSEKIFENCIAVTNNGSVGYAYYQEKPFTCTHDVNPLYIKKEYGNKTNKYIAMFLCTLIEKERFRWAYGRKWRPKRMPSSLIKLPAILQSDGTYTPDWQYMEDYVKNTVIPQLPKKAKEVWTNTYNIAPHTSTRINLNTDDWQPFNLNMIFDISYGNKLDRCQMEEVTDGIAFVTRTATNNGVGTYVEKLSGIEPYPPFCLSIALGGSIGATFLQVKPFYTSQNVAVLQPKEHLSKCVLLMIATLIEKECQTKFVAFGRELNKHIKNNINIKLPAILQPDGTYTPDWQFMEDYIKSLPYSKNI